MAIPQYRRHIKDFDLVLALISGRGYTVNELCELLKVSRRDLYYHLAFLRDYGFKLKKEGRAYYIGYDSPFLQRIASTVRFSYEEASYLYKLADAVEKGNNITDSVRQKLKRAYELKTFHDKQLSNQTLQNVNLLYQAIDRKRTVLLRDYASSHSGTVSNRVVEPFMFLNDRNDVRCYELISGKNKTFKVSRIGEVIPLQDIFWENESRHRNYYTDVFLFSGEQLFHVKLRLGLLSYNLLREEYPASIEFLTPDGDRHWIFETDVANYAGIGRFVIGLASDIEVLEDEGLRQYLRKLRDNMQF